jgi:hypothetical protein
VPRPEGCDCVARVEPDSHIHGATVFVFERHEVGVRKTIACCGLFDGTLTVFELVRLPDHDSVQAS